MRRKALPSANSQPAQSRYRYVKRRYRVLAGLIDAVGRPLLRLAGMLSSKPKAAPIRSILVVQLDHIGDAVLTTPMLRALRRRFPRAAIDVLASHGSSEIFHGHPAVRNVLVSQRNWHERQPGRRVYVSELFEQARRLRRFGYDLGVDPRGDILVAALLWLAGIPRRLGWDSAGGSFLLTDVAYWVAGRHEADSRLALLAPLGVTAVRGQPELFPSWADRYAIRESRASCGELRAPVIVVHVAAGTSAKQWPLSHYARLLERLTYELGGSVILVGAHADADRARQIEHRNPYVLDWTGRLSLMQLAALVADADLFIGGDSGPSHIAAAVGTPCVVLFSGTNRAECWQPVGNHVVVLKSAVACAPCHLHDCPVAGHPCMSHILPWEVVEAAKSILRRNQTRCIRPRQTVPAASRRLIDPHGESEYG